METENRPFPTLAITEDELLSLDRFRFHARASSFDAGHIAHRLGVTPTASVLRADSDPLILCQRPAEADGTPSSPAAPFPLSVCVFSRRRLFRLSRRLVYELVVVEIVGCFAEEVHERLPRLTAQPFLLSPYVDEGPVACGVLTRLDQLRQERACDTLGIGGHVI